MSGILRVSAGVDLLQWFDKMKRTAGIDVVLSNNLSMFWELSLQDEMQLFGYSDIMDSSLVALEEWVDVEKWRCAGGMDEHAMDSNTA